MKKSYYQILCLLIFILTINACMNEDPIKIGFAVELTGTRGNLGVDARDGALLAIKQINENGGIMGHPVELIVKDDKGDPNTARIVDLNLIDEGVIAIIGHITSSQTAAVIDLINKNETILFSPSSTSSLFSGKADYFFRNVPSSSLFASSTASYIFENAGINKLIVVFDVSNSAFSEAFKDVAENTFKDLGGITSVIYEYIPGESDIREISKQISNSSNNAVLLITSPVDTALFAQHIRNEGGKQVLFSSSWAHDKTLLEKGGRAVEGIRLISDGKVQDTLESLEFNKDFMELYGRTPGMLSSNSYEAVKFITDAFLEVKGDSSEMPQALSDIRNNETIIGRISLDEYGDVIRDVSIFEVVDGEFTLIDTISPQK